MEFNDILEREKKKPYFIKLNTFLEEEYKNKSILPAYENIYKAFELTPFNKIKVVLIGQDPYQTKGFANGLSFSVNDGIKIPKSLNNIFKEINAELGLEVPKTGNLEPWANKGILLLNRILTVEEGTALSHKNIGWEEFTLNIIKEINNLNQKIVFILLGNEAKALTKYLNNPNHLILCSSHPSPLGAYHGFMGSGIFKKCIEFLQEDNSFWSLE